MSPAPAARALLALAASLFAASCRAGPTLEALAERHRQLLDHADAGTATPAPARPRRIDWIVGERDAATPVLIGESIAGGSGLRVVQPVVEPGDTSFGLEVRLGVALHHGISGPRLEGSYIGLPLPAGTLYGSYESRHWGPGWFGSLILDGAAPPLAAAGWRYGDASPNGSRWFADFFVGTLSGHSEPADPKLLGMRVQWRPNEAWTVGFSRTMQWGGKGRNESFDSFFNGLLGRDNDADSIVGNGNEPGNQLAGIDLRYDVEMPRGRTLGLYAQTIGEDFSGTVPTRKLWLAGIDGSATIDGWSVHGILEVAHTRAGSQRGGAYRHHIYKAGYTHRGQPLGHPIGGDARLLSLGMLFERGPLFALLAGHIGHAESTAQLFTPEARLKGADGAIEYGLDEQTTLGASASLWYDSARRNRSAQLWARYSWR